MNSVKTFVTRLFKDEGGAGMVEYALICALVGVVLIATFFALAGGINNALGTVITALGGGAAPVLVGPAIPG